MPEPTPIRRPAPVCNLRAIRDPRISVDAMVEAIDAIRSDGPAGLCSIRWNIVCCICRCGTRAATLSELLLCTGLKRGPLLEHVKAMRCKGYLTFECFELSPSALAMVRERLESRTECPEGPQHSGHPGEGVVAQGLSPVIHSETPLPEGETLGSPVGGGRSPTPSPRPKATQTRKAHSRATIDIFAEHLAEGLSVTRAAVEMGFMPEYGHALLGRIRRKLGAQAV